MVFENGVKNIQAAAYNGARTVFDFFDICQKESHQKIFLNLKLTFDTLSEFVFHILKT